MNIFHNNTNNGGYPQVTDEAIIAANPQFVILTEEPAYGGNPALVYKRPNWSSIDALKLHQVYHINVNIGNGTTELIWAIAHAYLKPGLKAATLGPTFGEYRVACLAAGATVVEFQAQASACFQPDTAAVAAWTRREQPSLVWLCNPNNPTGTWLDQQHIKLVAAACQGTGVMLVVDEAYWRFVFPHEVYSAVELVDATRKQQVMVLRSLTKDCALAGLRLGYAIATPDVAERLGAQLPSWNVNGVAQAAGSPQAMNGGSHMMAHLQSVEIDT